MVNLPIGQIFLNNGLITSEQLDEALSSQKKKKGSRLANILLEKKYITEMQYLEVLSSRLNVKYVTKVITGVPDEVLRLLDYKTAREMCAMPVDFKNGVLGVLMHDPLDFYLIEDISILTGYEVKQILATKQVVYDSIETNYNNALIPQVTMTDNNNRPNALTFKSDASVVEIAKRVTKALEVAGFQEIKIEKIQNNEVAFTIKLSEKK